MATGVPSVSVPVSASRAPMDYRRGLGLYGIDLLLGDGLEISHLEHGHYQPGRSYNRVGGHQ